LKFQTTGLWKLPWLHEGKKLTKIEKENGKIAQISGCTTSLKQGKSLFSCYTEKYLKLSISNFAEIIFPVFQIK